MGVGNVRVEQVLPTDKRGHLRGVPTGPNVIFQPTLPPHPSRFLALCVVTDYPVLCHKGGVDAVLTRRSGTSKKSTLYLNRSTG